MVKKYSLIPKFTIIRDTHTIDSFLGEGAFGRVYKARHKYLGMQALKVFHPDSIAKEKVSELLNEAFVLSKLTHENVVRAYEANTFLFENQEYPYISMEFVNGGTLDSLIRERKQLPLELILSIQKDICRGLSEGHKMEPPLIHRDVKPQNIMLSIKEKKIVAKVSDFGLARHVDPTTRMTTGGGTLAYLPPEGFWNYEVPASDVFSAGIIFYIMLTGSAPFHMPEEAYGSTMKNKFMMAIKKSRNQPPEMPSKRNPNLDRQIDELVLKALELDPKKRYSDACEFLRAVEEYQINKESLNKKINEALCFGKQYSTLKKAINLLESIIRDQPKEKQIQLLEKYREVLMSWKKGILM